MTSTYIKKAILPILAAVMTVITPACHTVNDDRIPPYPVNIAFTTIGVWDEYGVAGATSFKYFIKSSGIPTRSFYSAASETGFGGVLLVGDFLGDLHAYDMACPVEVKRDVRIAVDTELNVAVCPKCGSTYDIYRYGGPLSGEAHDKGYGLKRYNVLRPGPYGEAALIRQ
ncbi:MAG: hypothetical protein NC043_09205 [Muribaculaceae bacterium]|nr:hypothetical protein [Muribaculaceae bacterium]